MILPNNVEEINLSLPIYRYIDKIPSDFKAEVLIIGRHSLVTEIPEGISIDVLDISESKVTKLPKGLKLRKLIATNSLLSEIPDDIIVESWSDISNTSVIEIPVGAFLGDCLKMRNSMDVKFPINFTIGKLDLTNSSIIELPEGLEVRGSLILDNCKNLKKLPDIFIIGKELSLLGTSIKIPSKFVISQGVTTTNILKESWYTLKIRDNNNDHYYYDLESRVGNIFNLQGKDFSEIFLITDNVMDLLNHEIKKNCPEYNLRLTKYYNNVHEYLSITVAEERAPFTVIGTIRIYFKDLDYKELGSDSTMLDNIYLTISKIILNS